MDRDYILTEIRRTTAENGGTPLGRDRFLAATGIREHEWNKYWPRWSAAVRAAGLPFTSRFNVAIPEATLLEKLSGLVRELGKFPVIGELTVKATADSSFPNPSIYRRFGGMPLLAEKLRVFAIERGYDDVAALCPTNTAPKPVGRSKPIELGSVYLVKSGKFFKIGHSNAVGRREREIALQMPEKLKLVHEIKTDDPAGIEDYWHRRFDGRRRNGEWFDLTADDVAAFRRRKVM